MPKFSPTWRTGAPACCLFCHEEYMAFSFHHGTRWTWHKCPGAKAEQKRLKAEYNRTHWEELYSKRGKVLVHRERTDLYRMQKREICKGVKIKSRLNECHTCHQPTVNRFHCPTCLDRISSGVDLDMMMECGESRRMGLRG